MSCIKKENKNKVTAQPSASIYHERQVKEMCALHALNNLFQDEAAYSKKDLDAICNRLCPDSYLNPHRSILGLGNYDVNVIMAALQSKECEAVWFDKRRDLRSLVFDNIKGFILNLPSEMKWGMLKLPIHRKHWICIRQINSAYYNLDSKLDAPKLIGSEEDLYSYLDKEIRSKDTELLLVVEKHVSDRGAWKYDTVDSDASGISQTTASTTMVQNGFAANCDKA